MADLARLSAELAGARAELLEIQRKLTAIPALGPENGGQGEAEKAALVAEYLASCQISDLRWLNSADARVASGFRPNLLAFLPGKSPRRLWLFAHLDVVPPGDPAFWQSDPWKIWRGNADGSANPAGDWVFGRGVEDNQQAVASMLILARAIKKLGLEPDLSLGLVFMADEECGSRHGLAHILAAAPELFSADDFYIVPDAGSSDGSRIEVAEKGQLWFRVECLGRQCHASTPEAGLNAMLIGSEAVLALHQGLSAAYPGKDPLFAPPCSTFVPTKRLANVEGVNILPGRDCFYFDCRLLPGLEPEAVLECARAIAGQLAQKNGAQIRIEPVQVQAASSVSLADPGLERLERAIVSVLGVKPRPVGIGGATVAAFLRARGLPALVWSSIANTCHQPNERSSLSATIQDAQVFARLLFADHAHGAF